MTDALLFLVLIGVILYAVNSAFPMNQPTRMVVGGLAILLCLVVVFGVHPAARLR